MYNDRRCIRTYNGHKQGARDITFNNDGKNFLSASYDRYVKLWDTETGMDFLKNISSQVSEHHLYSKFISKCDLNPRDGVLK